MDILTLSHSLLLAPCRSGIHSTECLSHLAGIRARSRKLVSVLPSPFLAEDRALLLGLGGGFAMCLCLNPSVLSLNSCYIIHVLGHKMFI